MQGLISQNNNYVGADQGLLFNGNGFPVREKKKGHKTNEKGKETTNEK